MACKVSEHIPEWVKHPRKEELPSTPVKKQAAKKKTAAKPNIVLTDKESIMSNQ